MRGFIGQKYQNFAMKLLKFHVFLIFFSASIFVFSNVHALDPEIKPGASERFEIPGTGTDVVVDEQGEASVETETEEPAPVEIEPQQEVQEALESQEEVSETESVTTETVVDDTPPSTLSAVPGADIDFVETDPAILDQDQEENIEATSEADSGEPEDMGQVSASESQRFALQRKQGMAETLFDQLDVLTFFEVDQKERSCDQEEAVAQMRCEGSKAKLLKLLEMDAYRTACRQKGIDFLLHVMDYHRLAYANAYHTAVDHYKVREIVRSENYDRDMLQTYMNESFQRLDKLGFNPAETQTRIEAQHIRRDVTLVCGRMMKYFAAERPMEEMQAELDEIFRNAVPQAEGDEE